MSIQIVGRVFLTDLEPMRKLVMLTLAQRADESGVCYPGMAYIARYCSITERGAQKILRELEAAGWISTSRGGGRKRTNFYQIALDRLDNPEHGSGFDDDNPEHGSGFPRKKPRTAKQETPNSEAINPEHGSPDSSEIHQLFVKERERTNRSPKGSRIPPDFPDAESMVWAKQYAGQEAPGLDVKLEEAKFVDRFTAAAGKDGIRADWPATWRNWIRRACEWRKEKQQGRAPGQQRRSAAVESGLALAGLTPASTGDVIDCIATNIHSRLGT